ncbi:MAG: hypothetical protein IPN74_20455 [Haliscomenobacter sp.]|nr:hypothetical protein [Haliscomenobacter sp.]
MEKLHHISARSKTLILILGLWGLVVLAPAQRPFQYRYGMEQGCWRQSPIKFYFPAIGESGANTRWGKPLRFDGVTWTHYRTSKLGFPGGMIFRGENRFGIWWEAIGSVQPARIALFTPQGTWKGYSIDARGTVLWDEEHEEPVFIDSLVTAYRYNVQARHFACRARSFTMPGLGTFSIVSEPDLGTERRISRIKSGGFPGISYLLVMASSKTGIPRRLPLNPSCCNPAVGKGFL